MSDAGVAAAGLAVDLGRHVLGLEVVDDLLRDRAAAVGAGTREVEARQPHAAVGADEDVRRRDVPVNDLVRLQVPEGTQAGRPRS